MRKKRLILLVLCLTMILFMLGGCGQEDEHKNDIKVYYLNLNGNEMQTDYFDPSLADGREGVELYLYALTQDPENPDLRRTIPDSVEVENWQQDGYFLTIDFSESYLELETAEEVLIRGAVVRTLCQCDDVAYINFQVMGEPLEDGHGNVIGDMSADSFVENADQAINTNQAAKLTLYFASSDGSYLVPETQTVYYNTSESLEKLIVEKLIEGPKTEGLQATIPSSSRIITISVMDGVCYVNLDSNFLSQNQEITEDVVLYSIVDSLTELDEVERVQISVNGDTSGKIRFIYELAELYNRNEAILIPTQEIQETEAVEQTN